MMKRRRSQEEEEEKKMKMKMIMEMAEEMAKCVVKLSSHSHDHVLQATPISVYRPAPMEFECKTCNRRFSSFQALGGHRASHRKPRHGNEDEDRDQLMEAEKEKEKKKKKHECGICGAVFSMGQALGGHMRRHKALLVETNVKQPWMLDLNLTPLENDINLLFSTSYT